MRILRTLASIVAGVAVAAVILLIGLHLVGGWRVVAIASGSMQPAIARGDLALVRPVPIQDIRTGDVILFSAGEQTKVEVVHRVESVVNLNLTVEQPDGSTTTTTRPLLGTRGDANASSDPQQVDERTFKGIVYAVLPGLGQPLLTLPVGLILVGVATLIGIAWAGYELRQAGRRRALRNET